MPDSAPPIIIGPIIALLRSRKVLVAIAAMIVSILVTKFPELIVIRTELLTLIVGGMLAIIGGISLEDAANAGRTKAAEPPEVLEDQIRELIDIALQDLLSPPDSGQEPVVVPSDHG